MGEEKHVVKIIGNLGIKQIPSKESLYNELLSTFDYSMGKRDKHLDALKQNSTSSMSLLSLNQLQ
jgi:hypothetical protein